MADLVQKIFQWVAVARLPLTLDELREAVSIEIGQPYSKPERQVRDMSRIALWCENLLQINEEEPQSVQFAHSTVRDFITTASLPAHLRRFRVSLEEADHFVGEICTTFVNLNDFKTTVDKRRAPLPQINPMAIAGTALSQDSKTAGLGTRLANLTFRHPTSSASLDLASYGRADASGDLDRLQQSHPFLGYAAEHWIFHTTRFKHGSSRTWDLWLHILTSNHDLARVPWRESASPSIQHAMLLWAHQTRHWALLRYANSLPQFAPESAKLMTTSASDGDIEVVEIFLETSRFSLYGISNALQAASGGGHLLVVERLLSAGANVNAAAGGIIGGCTTLQAASEGGHHQVVNRLRSAGASHQY